MKLDFFDFLKYYTIQLKDFVKMVKIMSTDLEMQQVSSTHWKLKQGQAWSGSQWMAVGQRNG